MSDDRSYPDRPIPGVGTVVWREGEVLLIQRAKEPGFGQWSLPGGTQELGETLEQAAIREVREEAGVEITNLQLIGAFDSLQHDQDGRVQHHYAIIDYDADWASGTPSPGEEESDARFFALHELETIDLWHPIYKVIELSRARRNVIA